MTMEQIMILAYFVFFAVINLVLYFKLAKFWYMSAGVTKEDVAVFMREHITDNRYRYLIQWLRKKAKDKKQFNIMLLFLAVTGFFVLPAPTLAFTAVWIGSLSVVKIFMIIEAVCTVLVAYFGFSYGRRIEAETETYYNSSQYKPYEGEDDPEEIEDLDELYDEPEEKSVYSPLEDEEIERIERKKFIIGYAQKLGIAALMLFFLFSPIILKDFNFKTFSFDPPASTVETDQNHYGYGEEDDGFENPSKPDVNITYIRELLIKEGYSPEGEVDQVSEKYPDFLFEDCLVADDLEMHFEYFKMVNREQAENFMVQLKSDISAQYVSDPKKDIVTEEKNSGFSIYTLETDTHYAAAVLEDDGILYVRCDKVSTTWMKVFLYDLGYLETF